jgi:hypothetical protein
MTESMSAADLVGLIRKAAAATVNAQAELGLERTRNLVPREDDTLADSLEVSEATPADLTAQLSTDVVYAVWQHEALYIEHPTGQAKFMESAVVGADSLNRMQHAGAQAALRALGG